MTCSAVLIVPGTTYALPALFPPVTVKLAAVNAGGDCVQSTVQVPLTIPPSLRPVSVALLTL